MRIALSGASGLVGRWIVRAAQAAGHQVIPLSRPDWRLGQTPDLGGCEALVHAAFQHVPGRYRGGEGDDPQTFIAANLDGSLRLFQAARDSGVGRVIFLSSRAVHDGYPAGTRLSDDLSPIPTSLYGQLKAEAETALAQMATPDFRSASLRPTGVYGPGLPQKWAGLIADFLAGTTPPPAVATEVHGADLADALLRVLADPAMSGSYNVSDLVLDRHDLLAGVARLTGCKTPLPARAGPAPLRVPACDRLRALGWRPGGMALLHRDLPGILGAFTDDIAPRQG
ncbi:NAD-dependent epimerase/dehydratase family protein [Paracoccus lutimaris]|uniref:Nucleoside-diphosphate-sugar epimerase n=1 Tax=Paracoccus lutimaris TaxID=1490030 RepID=A0A368YUE7_9RHOB|nr:NAD(P)-dependent oxidoreductase [Paracoccus lutimaris]RCW83842.1 nucleoside-diphosphate-sugar epimerase [Paracoccus lutimaris]